MAESAPPREQYVIDATPELFPFSPSSTALIVIDPQVDFMEAGGWADAMDLGIEAMAPVIPIISALLKAFRSAGMLVIYTREGYRPDLADCPPSKRGRRSPAVGDNGPRGRFMIVGEPGNQIISQLAPVTGEPVIDKPGAGAFHATLFDQILRLNGISSLIVTGVTADVCVNMTIREANDRGYNCLLVEDATASYNARFNEATIAMLRTGIAGGTTLSHHVLAAIQTLTATNSAA